MTTETPERADYLSCAETAKVLRAALKREFPGVKFSVRSHTYSGGASIDVRWTDGPTTSQVKALTSDYEGGRFDGMIDLAYHAEHWLTPDGVATVRRVYGHSHDNETVTPDRPAGARLVHFLADYVFEHRTVSDEWAAECERAGLETERIGTGVGASDYCRGCGRHFFGTCSAVTVKERAGTVDETERIVFTCSDLCAGRVIAEHTARPTS